jgi:hypothetical protein
LSSFSLQRWKVEDEQCPVIHTVSLKRERKKKSTVYRLSYRMATCPNEKKKKKKKKNNNNNKGGVQLYGQKINE